MPFLWAIALMVVSYGIQMLLQPKSKTPKAASLEEFDFPQFEEDTDQTVIFGDVWIEDWYVGWYGNLRSEKVESKGGGK